MNYLFAPESIIERQSILEQLTVTLEPDHGLEMYSDFDSFSARLRLFNNPQIIIMLGVCKSDIENLLSLSELIRDAAIIILHSEDSEATIKLAIRLRPKFIGSLDTYVKEIIPIVKKLIQNQKARAQKIFSVKELII
ncbi:MAG: hypothetical protein JXR76_19845 [Deltaproteobacteria bacterium]|nr:hypothetical protein [Deltaproteobacteria bacterium]